MSSSGDNDTDAACPAPCGAPMPLNESQRLATLHRYEILDTVSEQVFDDLVKLAARVCGMPMALITFVDADRQWFKARVGIDLEQTPRNVSFCAYTTLDPDQLLEVPDATCDPRFSANPLVTQDPGIRFYAGAPLVANDGQVLGALCVADRAPRSLDDEQRHSLAALGRQVMAQMELRLALRHADSRRLALQREHLQLALRSMVDPLTGVANRRAFDQRLRSECEGVTRERPLSLLLLDVDHFKSFNDSFGHAAGDETLRVVGGLLKGSLRGNDMAARVGGEEFALLLPGASPDVAMAVAERVRSALQNQAWPSRPVTASIGVATLSEKPAAGASAETWLYETADRGLYRAKNEGRNRVRRDGPDTEAPSSAQRTPREARYSS